MPVLGGTHYVTFFEWMFHNIFGKKKLFVHNPSLLQHPMAVAQSSSLHVFSSATENNELGEEEQQYCSA
jgi:hypothetical protein